MSASVVQIKQDAIDVVSDLPELIKAGEVTHAFMVMRLKDGTIKYKAVGIRDSTYLVGMTMKGIMAFDREHGWDIGQED